MELTTKTKETLELLPLPFVRHITANGVKVRDMDDVDLINACMLLFPYEARAFKITEPITDFDKKELKYMVKTRCKSLTIEEIHYAFKLERLGELSKERTPHYNRMDCEFVGRIINKYVEWKSELRRRANIEEVAQQIPEPTLEEKKEWLRNGTMRAYDHYKEHGSLETGMSYVYDVLDWFGLTPRVKDKKWEAMAKAKEQLFNEALDNKKARFPTTNKFQEYVRGLENRHNGEVKTRAKEILICEAFDNIARYDLEKILKA